jgi:hypothetical protein
LFSFLLFSYQYRLSRLDTFCLARKNHWKSHSQIKEVCILQFLIRHILNFSLKRLWWNCPKNTVSYLLSVQYLIERFQFSFLTHDQLFFNLQIVWNPGNNLSWSEEMKEVDECETALAVRALHTKATLFFWTFCLPLQKLCGTSDSNHIISMWVQLYSKQAHCQ